MSSKWLFKVSEVECIRADSYGEPYDAMLTIKVVNGECHVVRLLAKVDPTRDDYREIEGKIKSMGFSQYTISRNENGTLVNSVRFVC
tara:strand:+ start:111 stop:371 length:261 start_codon:yes stop_codon:yes gene_type:complete